MTSMKYCCKLLKVIKTYIIWFCTKTKAVKSVEFLPHQHPAESEEGDAPGGGYAHAASETGGLCDAPASQHDVPHPLHSLGVRQQPGERLHPVVEHPLQRPDEAAEQHVVEAGSYRELDGIR